MRCVSCQARQAVTAEGWCSVCTQVEMLQEPAGQEPLPRPGDHPFFTGAPAAAAEVAYPPPPPPPHAYGYAPPPVIPAFRPLRGLAVALTVLLIAGAVADLVSLVVGVRIRGLMDRLMTASDSEIDTADTLYGLTGIAQVLCLLATATVFIIWFHRSHKNAGLFDAGQLRRSSGWAVGAWFIPIWNLWLVKQIANDVWRASDPPQGAGSARPTGLGLVTAWWLTFLFSSQVGGAAARRYQAAETPDALSSAVAHYIFSDVLTIVAAVLAILYIRKLSGMQEAKQYALAGGRF